MSRPAQEHPTGLEHQFLKILWQESPQSVREIRNCSTNPAATSPIRR